MTLKDKLENIDIVAYDSIEGQYYFNLNKEGVNEIVNITEEFAIGFADWMRENEVYIAIDDIGDYAFDIGVNNYTSKELLEIYKKTL